KLRAVAVNGNTISTAFIGHELLPSYVKSLIRRRRSLIQNVDDVVCADNKKMRLKSVCITQHKVSEQKKKQVKLHTYYFNSYSNGTSYSSSEDNAHIKMLKKGETTLNLKVDSNSDGRMTLDEINKFVSSEAYIKYFRDTYINYSYAKLDENKDKKLSMDEFNNFNSKIKDPNVADFQLLEEFADYDYNSSRNLELEEYEDFFMAYLLVKVGAEK
ncbi:MAG: hypothetical protein ACK4IX_04690, partial [Candidatus Sericytochromatia bacterium]